MENKKWRRIVNEYSKIFNVNISIFLIISGDFPLLFHSTQAPEGIALLQRSRVIDVYKDGPELAT